MLAWPAQVVNHFVVEMKKDPFGEQSDQSRARSTEEKGIRYH